MLSRWPGNQCVSVCWQWVVTVNVVEAAALAASSNEWAASVGMIIMCPFTPYFFVTQDGYFAMKDGTRILGIGTKNCLPGKWYLRSYYIFLSGFHATNDFFRNKDGYVYAALTCVLPLVGAEVVDRSPDSCPRWFLVRVGGLWVYMFVAGFVAPDFSSGLDEFCPRPTIPGCKAARSPRTSYGLRIPSSL
jgi:hypothetical protein